jgi:hypothetical protein
MKKTLVVCCLTAVLAGCGQEASNDAAQKEKGKGNSMDSPIIISDNSTHLKHKAGAGNINFEVAGNAFVVIASSAGSVNTVEFKGDGWSASPGTVSVSPGWALTFYSDAAGTAQTLALTSPASAANTIATATFSNAVKLSTDNSADETAGGTSIDDATTAYQSVNLTPSTGGTAKLYVCSTPGAGKCKIKLHYGGN